MKQYKKLISLLLTVAVLAAMVVNVFAVQTGQLTISGTTKGETYALYKVLHLTQSGGNYSYTVTDSFKNFSAEIAINGESELITGETLGDKLENQDNSTFLSTLAQKLAEYALDEDNSVTAAKKVTGGEGTTKVDGLEYGYYLLIPFGASGPKENYATMFSLNTLSGNDTNIVVKGVYPTLEKTVGNNNAAVNAASIGDEVTFTLTSEVPDMTGYNKYFFNIEDTLSAGLDFQSISEIKIGDTALSEDKTENHDGDGGYYFSKTDNADGTETLKIVFKNFIQYKTSAGESISIKYSAALNENALIGGANTNSAKLIYSNDPSTAYSGDEPNADDPKGETTSSKTETYTTSLTINKVDGSNKALTGAAFSIEGNGVKKVVTTGDVYVKSENGTYYKLKEGNYTTTAPTESNESLYESTTQKYEKKDSCVLDNLSEDISVEAFVNAEGKLTFAGLGEGTYTITEIVTPEGYNRIDPFKVTISFNAADKKFTATANESNTVSSDNSGNTLSMNVVNQSGGVLPGTGGIGTTMFYLLGALLVICAGVLLVTRTRMRHSK